MSEWMPPSGLDLIVIDKGVPMPKRTNRKYPWAEMQVSDSFLVRCSQAEIKFVESSLTSCRNYARKKTGFVFVLRRTNLGMRVFRVK